MLHLILPTTGPQPMLKEMLASLAEHTDPCHLVVVLNTDQAWRRAAVAPDLECLIDNKWQVTLIQRQEPIGYVRACNLGWRALEAAAGDLVAVLNDDLVFKGRWVKPLEAALEAGAYQVGPSLKTVGADGMWGGPEDPPYIEGWCFMMRFQDALNVAAGFLDLFNRMFIPQLCEDMDFSLRIGEQWGFDPIRQVDIPVEHVRHQTCDPATQPENAAVWAANRHKLIQKWNLGGVASADVPPGVRVDLDKGLPDPTPSILERLKRYIRVNSPAVECYVRRDLYNRLLVECENRFPPRFPGREGQPAVQVDGVDIYPEDGVIREFRCTYLSENGTEITEPHECESAVPAPCAPAPPRDDPPSTPAATPIESLAAERNWTVLP